MLAQRMRKLSGCHTLTIHTPERMQMHACACAEPPAFDFTSRRNLNFSISKGADIHPNTHGLGMLNFSRNAVRRLPFRSVVRRANLRSPAAATRIQFNLSRPAASNNGTSQSHHETQSQRSNFFQPLCDALMPSPSFRILSVIIAVSLTSPPVAFFATETKIPEEAEIAEPKDDIKYEEAEPVDASKDAFPEDEDVRVFR